MSMNISYDYKGKLPIPVENISPAPAPPVRSAAGPLSSIDPILMPTAVYQSTTRKIDISSIPEFSVINSITDGIQKVSFSSPMERLMVPNSWGTWDAPPFSETATPPVLFSQGLDSMTWTLSVPAAVFGFEIEPNMMYTLISVTVDFYCGSSLVGSITRELFNTPDDGARVFAARTLSQPFSAVVITAAAGSSGFAVAQVRYALPRRGRGIQL